MLASGIRDTLFEPVVDQHAIRQARERVARGEELNTFFGTLALGDVGGCAGHAQRESTVGAFRHFAF